LTRGERVSRNAILRKLVDMLYERNDVALARGKFRARGNIIEICQVNQDTPVRIVLQGDKIADIVDLDPVTGQIVSHKDSTLLFPARHFVTPPEKLNGILDAIDSELEDRLDQLRIENKLLEAQRLEQRSRYDMEMIRNIGYCSGIETILDISMGEDRVNPKHLDRLLPQGLPDNYRRVTCYDSADPGYVRW